MARQRRNRARAYTNRGLAYQAKAELDRAIADYNRAIELDPKLAFAYSGRADNHGYRTQKMVLGPHLSNCLSTAKMA